MLGALSIDYLSASFYCINGCNYSYPINIYKIFNNLRNRNLLGISNIRHAISGVKNCNLNKPPWRVGDRNTMKNFAAPKYLRSYVTSHYYQVYHCVMNTTITTLKASIVTKLAPHRSYCQTRSFAHLDNAMVIRHIGIKTTHI